MQLTFQIIRVEYIAMINKIGFISYTVSNLQQSIKFYQNLLGLELLLNDDRWAEFNISGQRFAIHEKTNESIKQDQPSSIVYFEANPIETIVKDTDIKKGKKLSKNFLSTTKNYIENKYKKEGFLNTKVTIDTKADTTAVNNQKMLISVDRGDRVKVRSITFKGNEVYKSKKLSFRKAITIRFKIIVSNFSTYLCN